MTHIKSLGFVFQKKNISQQRRTELERAGRRYGRKFTVSGDLSATKQNRIDNNPILDLSTALRSVLTASPTFATYGNDSAAWGQWQVNGMSSDESDYEELPGNPPIWLRSPRYYVLKPRWRHSQLSEWLETFDMIYSIIH
jgi:hypothetical protein